MVPILADAISTDLLKRKIDKNVSDLPGMTGIADDLVMLGFEDDGSVYDMHLEDVLNCTEKAGVKFNPGNS